MIYIFLSQYIHMKIQKKFIREYKGKKYYKYIVHIPAYILEEADLKEDDEVEISGKNKKIILEKIDRTNS